METDLVDEISRHVELDRETLLAQGVEAFLRERKRRLMLDRHDILTRYHVSSAPELAEEIESGARSEHPTWEDLITLENLEAAIAELDGYLEDLQAAA